MKLVYSLMCTFILSSCNYILPEKYTSLAQKSIEKTAKVSVHAVMQDGSRFDVLGAGAVISYRGHILTAQHLFNVPHSSFTVQLHGSTRSYRGIIIMTDEDNDLALITISTPAPNIFRLAGYSDITVGQEVIAIGHPLGLDWTVTHGIVSQKRPMAVTYTQYIQTDAAVNPGNSGGSLINLRGELLGINSHIRTPSAFPVNSGIAMASSIDAIHLFLSKLLCRNELKS